MVKDISIVVLDSCCVIDWMKGEPEYKNEADAMDELIEEMRLGKQIAVVSAAIVAEVLPRPDQERYGEFRRLYGEGTIRVQPLDVAVAEVVAHLRQELTFKGGRKTLDAIHLGTAIYSGAHRLYTRDDKLLGMNERLGMLKKNKPIDGFKICKLDKKRGLI